MRFLKNFMLLTLIIVILLNMQFIQCLAIENSKIYQSNEAITDKEPLPFSDFNFFVPTNEGKYIINSKGNINFINKNGIKKSFSLYRYEGENLYILKLYYILLKNNLFLIYNVSNGESGGAQITKIEHGKHSIIWDSKIPVNIKQSFIEDDNIYVVNSNGFFIGKLDINSGQLLWKRQDLRNKYHFNNIEKIKIENSMIELVVNEKVGGEKKQSILKLSEETGEELPL